MIAMFFTGLDSIAETPETWLSKADAHMIEGRMATVVMATGWFYKGERYAEERLFERPEDTNSSLGTGIKTQQNQERS